MTPLNLFHFKKEGRGGLAARCKVCVNLSNKDRISSMPPTKLAEQRHATYIRHREKRNRYSKEYLKKYPEKARTYNKNCRSSPEYMARAAEYMRTRRRNDPAFRAVSNLRSRLCTLLKRENRKKTTLKYLGCSIRELKEYLTERFQKGMSWDNYGEWHIDHVQPLASFDLSSETERAVAFYYKNLQPLWALDNKRKGHRIAGGK